MSEFLTEQEIRTKITALDIDASIESKVIADAKVTIATSEARIAGLAIERARLYGDFDKVRAKNAIKE